VSGASVDLARAVHQRTEGNALFVREVARTLVQEPDALQPAASAAFGIPEGLRDVIGRHLSRLSPTTNEILRVAAVIGREFRLDLLVRVMPLAEDDMVAGLEEACRMTLLEEHLSGQAIVSYRFRHLLFRQTLYEELSAPRRLRWHHLIGTALEEMYSGHLEDHAAELAEHFAHSSNVPDLEKAVAYGERAADRAMRVYAYSEAAHHLERALDIHDLVGPDETVRKCDLLLALGVALVLAGAVRRAVDDIAPTAHGLAGELKDSHRALRACTIALDALQAMGGASAETRPEWLEWAERADAYAQTGTADRVRADIALAAARSVRGRGEEAVGLWWRALELARKLEDRQAMWEAAYRVLIWQVPDQWSRQVELAREFSMLPRDGLTPRVVGSTLHWCAMVMLAEGDRERFEQLHRAARDIHASRYLAGAYIMLPAWDSVACELDGRFEEAVALCEQAVERGAEVHREVLSLMQAMFHMRRPLTYSGQVERYVEVVRAYVSAAAPPRATAAFMLASALTDLGRIQEAHLAVESFAGVGWEDGTVVDLVLRLELAIAWHDGQVADALAAQLAPVAHLAIAGSMGMPNAARLIGNAALLRRDVSSARRYFELAVERTRQIRFRPELALSRLDLAELLLDHFPSEASVAVEHLRAAIAEFEALGMQPALARAQRRRDTIASAKQSKTVPGGLTARECEVAALLGDGLTNREIARALVISEATVGVHVKHILSKLEFKSRARVAVWASEQGLGATDLPNRPVRREGQAT
jgi:DNA-binding NarL/FixJ family response regulator